MLALSVIPVEELRQRATVADGSINPYIVATGLLERIEGIVKTEKAASASYFNQLNLASKLRHQLEMKVNIKKCLIHLYLG